MNQIKAAPAAGSCATGLIASLCCGGSLIFASIGLGAFWSAFGLSRYVPQVLAASALSIVAINYFFYRRAAERFSHADDGRISELRQSMFLSAALGLAAMAASFIFLEWFNHAVINPHRFLAQSQYAQALIPGVPNIRLLYAAASFAALALLWALPFPQPAAAGSDAAPAVRWGLARVVLAATAVLIVILTVAAMPVQWSSAPASEQHSPVQQRKH